MFAVKKSGSAVFLMELMMVIMFFSLAVVVTLRFFMTAYHKEQESIRLNDAIVQAQNALEQFRVNGSGMFGSGAWTELPAQDGGRCFLQGSPEDETPFSVYVFVFVTDTPNGKLEHGVVQAVRLDEPDPLCRLELAKYSPLEVVTP